MGQVADDGVGGAGLDKSLADASHAVHCVHRLAVDPSLEVHLLPIVGFWGSFSFLFEAMSGERADAKLE